MSSPNIRVLATDLEFPEGPVVMPDGSVVLVEIRAPAPDANPSRRAQGDRREDSGRPERRSPRPGRQDLSSATMAASQLDPDGAT
jgi:hypothetical protein